MLKKLNNRKQPKTTENDQELAKTTGQRKTIKNDWSTDWKWQKKDWKRPTDWKKMKTTKNDRPKEDQKPKTTKKLPKTGADPRIHRKGQDTYVRLDMARFSEFQFCV